MHPVIEDGVPILKAAWTAHPDSFPLALTIGSQIFPGDEKSIIEAVGWCQTAVALRPNNPVAHYYHAVALSWRRRGPDVANAADELRRTIRLAPRFAKAYGRLAYVLYRIQGRGRGEDHLPEAVDAARTAIALDDLNVLGHYVLYLHLLFDKKDYLEAARINRRLYKLFPTTSRDREGDDNLAQYGAYGEVHGSLAGLLIGLIEAGRPFEAYRLVLDGHPPESIMIPAPGPPQAAGYYLAAWAAAQAGTGQGLDAPPALERPALRKHALEWFNAGLDAWKKEEAVLPVRGASTVGLTGSPFGQGPLLAVSALAAGSPDAAAESLVIIHEGMSQWLSDADLAGVRDDQWLAKLPADERKEWRKLWSQIRSLRDRTAPRKTPAKP
jgi:tetratricopeptide (TPR) repeat protein